MLVTYAGDFRVDMRSGVNPVPYPFSPSSPTRYVDKRDLPSLERWVTLAGAPMFAWEGRT